MNGMARQQMSPIKARHGNQFRSQLVQCGLKAREILRVGQNREIGVPAKLGRAVEHAGLPAHQQALHPVPAHRRKDFVYRVRDQDCLLVR